MNKDSAVRHINRTLQQYYDVFGADSAEYHNLLRDLEYNLGDAPRVQRGGAAAFSRSQHALAGMQEEDLQIAKDLTTGENSWRNKYMEVAEELESEGIEPTEENIRDHSKIKKEVSDWYNTIYKMFKERDETSVSDFAGNDVESQDDLVNKLGRIAGRKNIKKVIEDAKKWDAEKKAAVSDRAEKTPKQRLSPKESKRIGKTGIWGKFERRANRIEKNLKKGGKKKW